MEYLHLSRKTRVEEDLLWLLSVQFIGQMAVEKLGKVESREIGWKWEAEIWFIIEHE